MLKRFLKRNTLVLLCMWWGAAFSQSLPEAPPPLFSHEGGFYGHGFSLSLSGFVDGLTLRYTVDGSVPDASAEVYTTPISIRSTQVIRARAFSPDFSPSPVVTHTYFIESAGTLPSLSLVSAPEDLWDASRGIYANPQERGEEWERPISAEFFENGKRVFQVDVGLRIHGGISRSFAKKAFRLHFSRDYGPDRLWYPIFPDRERTSYDKLVLGNAASDSFLDPKPDYAENWTLLRDALANRLYEEMGAPSIGQRPVKLYLNGDPWGIYWLKERIDDAFLEEHYGYHEADLIKHETLQSVKEGDLNHWNQTNAFFESADFSRPEAYEQAQALVDVDNLIDHYLVEMWATNFDWPFNNNYQFRPRVPNGRWRWIAWDTELGMGNPSIMIFEFNMYRHVSGCNWLAKDESTLLFRKLIGNPDGITCLPELEPGNPDFRLRVANRAADLLNTTLHPDNVLRLIAELKELVGADVRFETDRWGSSAREWEENIVRLEKYARWRAEPFWEHTEDFFGLTGRYALTLEEPDGQGTVSVNRLEIDTYPWTGQYFIDLPVGLAAHPGRGSRFVRWEGATLPASAEAFLAAATDTNIRAVFEQQTSRPNPNDVIINEFWNDDDGTRYASIGGRPITGDWLELLVVSPEGVDLRNWRLTNHSRKEQSGPESDGSGSVLIPPLPQLAHLPRGTVVLLILSDEGDNSAYFDPEDVDASDGRLILKVGNGSLDPTTDPGFRIEPHNGALAFLSPGSLPGFEEDVGVDFLSTGESFTPESFGVDTDGVIFTHPFQGIGADDGAVFTGNPTGSYNNDDGQDQPGDAVAGLGGWIVDPPDRSKTDLVTPGALNPGQRIGFSVFDTDRSGRVDQRDLLEMLQEHKAPTNPVAGDSNWNGAVDSEDLFGFSGRYFSPVSDR